ncbi:MAG TPA: HtaA domain-containing protein [Caulobacteraceae bacterium]|nr:HtaA domain-containing protein [Caulobacteraceae bacterium]
MAEVASLTWGVKESFRNYVESAGGAIEVGGGAARAKDGEFTFAAADGGLDVSEDGAPQGTGAFVGEVKFEAHGGMLKVFLADPSLEIDEGRATVSVAEAPGRERRVALAELDLAAARLADGEIVIPAKLARDGWRVLGDHYAPMTPLDPVRLTLR